MDVGPLLADGVDLAAELVFGPAFFGGQVEEVVLLLVECVQAFGEMVAHVVGQAMVAVQRFIETGTEVGESFRSGGQHIPVVADDRVFQDFHWDVGQVAETFASPRAEKVVIVAFAVPSERPLDDHAVLAAGTPQETLEVVVVRVFASARAGVSVEEALHLLKQFLGDQRLVAAGVFDTVIRDHAHVVAVP